MSCNSLRSISADMRISISFLRLSSIMTNGFGEPKVITSHTLFYFLNNGTVLHASPYMRLFAKGRRRDTNST